MNGGLNELTLYILMFFPTENENAFFSPLLPHLSLLFRLAFVFFAGGCVDIMYFSYHLLLADYHEEDSHFIPSS